jgi:hypothetical protein
MSEPSPLAASAPKRRNPVERVLVWGGIVLLLGVVFLEYRAKQGYDATVRNLQEVTNGTRDVTMEDARKLMVGYSWEAGPTPNPRGFPTYTYTWFSLFRRGTYRLTLVANADGATLQTFDGPGFAEDQAALAARAAEHANAPLTAPPFIGAQPPASPPSPDDGPAKTPE